MTQGKSDSKNIPQYTGFPIKDARLLKYIKSVAWNANPLGVSFLLPALKCENKGEVDLK